MNSIKLTKISALLFIVSGATMLLASSETDRKIEVAAQASYNYRTVLENHVKVRAQDGVVTLTGKVEDTNDRDLADDTVKNLPGVTRVDDQLKIASAYPEHSDDWIALKVRGRLLVKANVSATTTTVAVKDGVVTLTGTADNLAQKELTGAYAKEIDWVKSVENNIVVNDHPSTSATLGERIDDASITAQVKFALLADSATHATSTDVTTTDAVVQLTGVVKSEAEKTLAAKTAQSVRGVKSVTNDLIVKS